MITRRKAQLGHLCAVQRVRVKGEDHNPECLNSGMGWGTETSSWTNGGGLGSKFVCEHEPSFRGKYVKFNPSVCSTGMGEDKTTPAPAVF